MFTLLLALLIFLLLFLSQEPPEDEANIIEKILSVRTNKKEVAWPVVIKTIFCVAFEMFDNNFLTYFICFIYI